jgi:hypothetical protein
MEKYAYLFLGILLMVPWAVIFIRNPFKSGMLRVSFAGGIAGLLAEYWYFRDYWKPPTLLGEGVYSPEDFIVGFALFGIPCYAHLVMTRRSIDYEKENKVKNKQFIILFFIGLSSLMLFNVLLGLNSGIVSILTFTFLSFTIWVQRPDLIHVSLKTAFFMLFLIGFFYYLLFNIFFPEFWVKYGLLEGTLLEKKWYNIPVSELFWYFTWGLLAGTFWEYRNGIYFKPLQN